LARYVDSVIRGSGKGEEPSGANALRLIRIRLCDAEFGKNVANLSNEFTPSANRANSSSTNAVSFSSAHTTKRFPSQQCLADCAWTS
jgi:hypothetical protein